MTRPTDNDKLEVLNIINTLIQTEGDDVSTIDNINSSYSGNTFDMCLTLGQLLASGDITYKNRTFILRRNGTC